MVIRTASGKETEINYIGVAGSEVLYIVCAGSLTEISSVFGNPSETESIFCKDKEYTGYTEVENIVNAGENYWRISLRRPQL